MVESQKDGLEPEGAWAQSLAFSFRFLFVVVCLLGAGWALSNVRMVPPDSRAVILRFGTVVRQSGAGILLALPRPLELVELLPSADRQIEYRIKAFARGDNAAPDTQDTAAQAVPISRDPTENGGMLLTGDMSVVHYGATLFYRITDANAFILAQEQVTPALERLFVASAISVTSRRDLDAILVARPERETPSSTSRADRERLRADLMAEVNRRLTDLEQDGGGFGITVSRVDLVPMLPAEAKSAFDSVLITLQAAEKQAAQARTTAATVLQQANEGHDRIVTDAQAKAEERVREAQTRTAAISALANDTTMPAGTSLIEQIYADRIGPLLQKAGQVFTTDGNSRLILPGSNQK
jgi:regulator of protease activity HflC (stomatin/prohibitin superfamily)